MKSCPSRLVLILIVLLPVAGPVAAETLPPDPDGWSEYATAQLAEADGWVRECGLSQAIVVDGDCTAGSWSVGCAATQARWCDEFGLEKAVSLAGVTGLHFWHRADQPGWNFQVRLVMQPTAGEAAQGVEAKRLSWEFPSATDWTEHDFSLAEGQWAWQVNGMWQDSGYEQTLTEMIGIKWFFCTYWGVNIGDRLLIDNLHLTREASPVLPAASGLVLTAPRPNPFNPVTRLSFSLDRSSEVRLAIYDMKGRRLRLLTDGSLGPGVHTVSWDGRGDSGRRVPAGAYLVCLDAGKERRVRKLMLVP